MSVVVEVIERYLQQHRRLVVPAFGAFVVKDTGERIFSDLLNSDDGVLISLLRDMGYNEMEAAGMVDRFIFEVRYDLDQYGYCRLGEVGTLRVEPETKVLKLYPPVSGEMPKQTPYVPQAIKEEVSLCENPTSNVVAQEERSQEPETQSGQSQQQVAKPQSQKLRKSAPKSRKKFDFVVTIAIIIVLAALVAIGYGWYVSQLSEVDDDAAMEALRIAPEQTIN